MSKKGKKDGNGGRGVCEVRPERETSVRRSNKEGERKIRLEKASTEGRGRGILFLINSHLILMSAYLGFYLRFLHTYSSDPPHLYAHPKGFGSFLLTTCK